LAVTYEETAVPMIAVMDTGHFYLPPQWRSYFHQHLFVW